MAYRFLDSEYFKKPFVRSLSPKFKLFYLYLICEAEQSGIWLEDFELASFMLKEEITREEFEEVFEGKFLQLAPGKIFFPDLARKLNPGGFNTNAHAVVKIREKLAKYGLLDENNELREDLFNEQNFYPKGTPPEGLKNPTKENIRENNKEKTKEKTKENKELNSLNETKKREKRISELEFPFTSELFLNAWETFIDYKKSSQRFEYKDTKSEQIALNKLAREAGDERTAILAIETTIANGWKGLFPDKVKSSASSGRFADTDQRARAYAESLLNQNSQNKF